MKVKYINPGREYLLHQDEISSTIHRVMLDGSFILREDVEKFEFNVAARLGVKHVIGLNSGTDALFYSLAALGLKSQDEVITVAHTFVATIASIVHVGATPVLVDIANNFNIDPYKIEEKITEKTKALLPVHMNGRACDMDTIERLSAKYGLMIIEDAAQAFGAKFKGRSVGTFGEVGCFSAHPMKVLGGPGDGGYVVTNSRTVDQRLRLLRNHGQRTKTDITSYGFSSRLDNLHAAILNVKLKYVDKTIRRRRSIALSYHQGLQRLPIKLPAPPSDGDYFDVYNSYVIRVQASARDSLAEFLARQGIEVFSHMAIPLFKNENLKLDGAGLETNEKLANEIISLPVYPELTDGEVEYVIISLKKFFNTEAH